MDAAFVSQAADIWASGHLFFTVSYKQGPGGTVNAQVRHKGPLRFPSCPEMLCSELWSRDTFDFELPHLYLTWFT